jgi:hypothetical protein
MKRTILVIVEGWHRFITIPTEGPHLPPYAKIAISKPLSHSVNSATEVCEEPFKIITVHHTGEVSTSGFPVYRYK